MIRQATIQDLDQLTTLFDQYLVFYQKPSNLERHKAYLKERIEREEAFMFLAFDDANETNALGFALCYPTFSSVRLSKIVVLNDLFVNPTIRNKGVGEQLIDQCFVLAKTIGADLVRLRTAKDNYIAQGLYHKKGFVRDELYYTYDYTIT